jgi:cell division protease FtsH
MPPSPTRTSKPSPFFLMGVLLTFALVGVLALILWIFFTPTAIDYSDFRRLVAAGKIEKVTIIGKDRLEGEIKKSEMDSPEVRAVGLKKREFQTELLQPANDSLEKELFNTNVKFSHRDDPTAWMTGLFSNGLLILIVLAVVFFIILPRLRDPMGGFVASYLRSPARRYEQGKTRVTFEDVADMANAKSELREIIDFLREPKKFERLGGQVPKGVLLIGPPGTGKTLLARAVAGEAEVPFYSINAAEFIQLYVGVGASRVRDLFKTAKENAPCLIFIDEIDAIGRIRGAGLGGGADEREQTLNQILGEMDGFAPNEMVIVIAATNRPDVLDSALLRPGRFDRHITVDRQNWQGRLAVMKVHTRNKPLADDVDLENLARQTTGMTGADLRNLCNEAALLATREGKMKIERRDFERAADRVLIGPKREELLNAAEKRATAYHESGHALLTWLIPDADRPMRVSIVPRGESLGVNLIVPEEEKYHRGEKYFRARLVTLMGGRAAERLVFDESFAGAEDDLRKATRLARYMVTHWGMSDRVGPMTLRIGEEHVFLGKEIQQSRDFSEGMAVIVDEETRRILIETENEAVQLLKANRAKLDRLAEELVKAEELTRAEIEKIVLDDKKEA